VAKSNVLARMTWYVWRGQRTVPAAWRASGAHTARAFCPSTTGCGFASALVIRRHRRGARQANGGLQRLPPSMRCRTAPAVTREFVV